MVTLPQSQTDTRVVSVTIPKDVHTAARSLVDTSKISLSLYVTSLIRTDLAVRKTRVARSPRTRRSRSPK